MGFENKEERFLISSSQFFYYIISNFPNISIGLMFLAATFYVVFDIIHMWLEDHGEKSLLKQDCKLLRLQLEDERKRNNKLYNKLQFIQRSIKMKLNGENKIEQEEKSSGETHTTT